ncbi:hypothetical protein FXF51_54580 [Nonomuraea sp. PA05]|nr:hypothetical protein FXF51_54580 [Nonomuraea sp. PA05]
MRPHGSEARESPPLPAPRRPRRTSRSVPSCRNSRAAPMRRAGRPVRTGRGRGARRRRTVRPDRARARRRWRPRRPTRRRLRR